MTLLIGKGAAMTGLVEQFGDAEPSALMFFFGLVDWLDEGGGGKGVNAENRRFSFRLRLF